MAKNVLKVAPPNLLGVICEKNDFLKENLILRKKNRDLLEKKRRFVGKNRRCGGEKNRDVVGVVPKLQIDPLHIYQTSALRACRRFSFSRRKASRRIRGRQIAPYNL